MERPVGMRSSGLLLSESQARDHNLNYVSTYTDRRTQDGWVQNEGANQQLCGSLVIHRRFRTKAGGKTVDQLVPIDSFLLQLDSVHKNIGSELDSIAGGYDASGRYHEGDLERVVKSRYRFLEWLTRTPQQEAALMRTYAHIADKHVHSRNLVNQSIGNFAERMRGLSDDTGRPNPRAMLAMTKPLERDLRERREQLVHDMSVNTRRGRGISQYIYEETLHLAQADNFLERLVYDQNEEYLFALKGLAKHVRFRVQVFNRLGHDLRMNGGHIDDSALAEAALSGHRFMPHKNFLSKTAREIIAGRRKDGLPRDEEPVDGMQIRLLALENMELHGPYEQLQERLLTLGSIVLEDLQAGNKREAKKSARDFLYLLTYHCLADDDVSDIQPWYNTRLS